jgi:FkbH-like protein
VRKGVRYLAAAASAPLWLRACDRVGLRARTMGAPVIDNRGRIELGDDVTLNSTCSPVELCAAPGGRIELGSGVAINFGTAIAARQLVRVGDRVSFGPYCVVSDSDGEGAPGDGAAPLSIEIGEGAWLASRVTVLPGAKIGKGSVISAGSVVRGEIPAGVVAGGIPARVLRQLDSQERRPPLEEERSESNKQSGLFVAPSEETHNQSGLFVAPAEAPALRGLVIADFTATELSRALASDAEAPVLAALDAPFGQVAQALLDPPAGAGKDFALVWTRPEAALPAFARLIAGEAASEAELLADVDAHCALLARGLADYRFAFVPTWTLPPWQRGLGVRDARPGGLTRALAAANLRLMEALARSANVHVLSAERWLSAAGSAAHAPKLWHLGKVPFGSAVFAEAAADVKAALRGLTGGARKLVVVDLDDTLWGGIVGDAGWQSLRVGGHDAIGEAHLAFQRCLKALTRRGVVLAIASKNEESVALEALRRHPEQLLRLEDFVGWRINWRDKAQSIVELSRELNLGLQSIVFLDDSPVERARVREALPEVLVPELPEDKLLYPSALSALRCFDGPAPSREDGQRTQLYAAERERDALKETAGSLDQWLRNLGVRVRAERLSAHNLARAVQLFNKTNQMNLRTRRLTEAELLAWAQDPAHELLAISAGDRFGDAGLTGILGLAADGNALRIADFVLSCRVMGRKIEEAIVHLAVERARARGLATVEAELLPTAKNKPCLDFWKGSGFAAVSDAARSSAAPAGAWRFRWDAREQYPSPAAVAIEATE